MPYLTLTLTENLKLQLSPGLVASYDIQPGNGVRQFWDKHTHVYLLTYLPRTHTGHNNNNTNNTNNNNNRSNLKQSTTPLTCSMVCTCTCRCDVILC